MRRIRISLRGLILLVTCLSLFLGYSQYGRNEILKACAELKRDKFIFSVPNEWYDRFWQRKPLVGTIGRLGNQEALARVRRVNVGHGEGLVYYLAVEPEETERLKELGMVDYK
jgi:hypothetical protein